MNKKYKKIITSFIFVSFAIFLYAEVIYLDYILNSQYNSVSIRTDIEDSLITIESIEKALENEKNKEKEVPEVTIWSSNKKDEIYSKDIYSDDYARNNTDNIKKIKVQTYEVYGKCKDVYPMELHCGSFVMEDDIYGCIIDESTCYELFGTKNAVGNSIVLNEKIYYIRGVAKINNPSMFIEINNKKDRFSNIEIVYSNDERGKEFAEKFMMENSLGEEYVIFDCKFYGKIIKKAHKIPIWIFAIFFMKKLLKIIYNNVKEVRFDKKNNNIFLKNIIICSVTIIFIIYVSKFEFYYPLRMIPSKWSDFNFWTIRFDELKTLIHEFMYAYPYPRDILLIQNFKKAILCIVLSCINAVIFLKHRKYFYSYLTKIKEY